MEFIQGWMISLVIATLGLVAMMAISKYKTEQNQKEIEMEKKAREALGKKMDKLVEETAEHKVKLSQAPSMEDVRKEFVSKEMFMQMEKHIDTRFDSLGKSLEKLSSNQDEILSAVRGQ